MAKDKSKREKAVANVETAPKVADAVKEIENVTTTDNATVSQTETKVETPASPAKKVERERLPKIAPPEGGFQSAEVAGWDLEKNGMPARSEFANPLHFHQWKVNVHYPAKLAKLEASYAEDKAYIARWEGKSLDEILADANSAKKASKLEAGLDAVTAKINSGDQSAIAGVLGKLTDEAKALLAQYLATAKS